MDIATLHLPRLWRLALVGAATAFAWIVFSLLLGLGSDHAHAAEDDGDKGLLGAVTSIVDDTASTATKTVSSLSGGASHAVNTVVAVAPAPVQKPVKEAVSTAGSAVSTVVKPVAEAAAATPVSAVVKPVVQTVSEVPVVGAIAEGAGLDEAVGDLVSTVDDTLGDTAGAVADVGATLGQPPVAGGPQLPSLPAIPGLLEPDQALSPAGSGVSIGDIAVVEDGVAASVLFALSLGHNLTASLIASGVVAAGSASDTGNPLSPAGGLCPPSVTSAGPGGAGSGAWALVAFGPLAALRAWGRRAGPEDDRVPAAPAGSTDVSPD